MNYKILVVAIILIGLFSFSNTNNCIKHNIQVKDTTANQSTALLERIKKGKTLYEKNCLMCHGISGKGDGSAGIYLKPRPFDISSEKVQIQNDSTLFYKITVGKAPMPSFKSLSFESRELLVLYVRELAKKKNK